MSVYLFFIEIHYSAKYILTLRGFLVHVLIRGDQDKVPIELTYNSLWKLFAERLQEPIQMAWDLCSLPEPLLAIEDKDSLRLLIRDARQVMMASFTYTGTPIILADDNALTQTSKPAEHNDEDEDNEWAEIWDDEAMAEAWDEAFGVDQADI